jgi:hypothetical protein
MLSRYVGPDLKTIAPMHLLNFRTTKLNEISTILVMFIA